jgi:LuxR family transcriptional activator of conjugal transfer of Ti plasmids
MLRIFQNFIDHLSSAADPAKLGDAVAEAAAALNLSCFAYLLVPQQSWPLS